MPSFLYILAEDFTGLGSLIVALLVILPLLAALSFLSSRRGRFPVLAIPAMVLSVPAILGCMMARSMLAVGFGLLFCASLILGVISICLWSQRKRS